MEIVDTYEEEPEDYFHMKQATEFVVDDTASMMVADGMVTFVNRTTGDSVSLSEWDFSNLDLAYICARMEEKNPRIKEHRLELEAHRAEEEKANDQSIA